MVFRKNSLLFYEGEVIYIVFVIVSLTLIPILGIGLSLLCALTFVILIVVNPWLHNEFITIDEIGISCHKSGKQIWAYEWNRIAKLQRSSRFRLPSIEIMIYRSCTKPEQYHFSGHYFQLGRVAKKAIRQYGGSQYDYI